MVVKKWVKVILEVLRFCVLFYIPMIFGGVWISMSEGKTWDFKLTACIFFMVPYYFLYPKTKDIKIEVKSVDQY